MRKKLLFIVLLLTLFAFGLLLTGCFDATVDPDTLNLQSGRGRSVVTAYVTSNFEVDVESIEVGYEGEWATSVRWSIEEIDGVETMIIKVDRTELTGILREAGVAEDVFEEYVDLDIKANVNIYGTQYQTYEIRVINPANAPEK